LHEADTDPEIRAVVLTGAGDKSFSAGADLKAISKGEDIFPTENREWGFAGMMQHPVSVPIIAAVGGTALGGGLEITLACDLVVAAEHAVFGLPRSSAASSPPPGAPSGYRATCPTGWPWR